MTAIGPATQVSVFGVDVGSVRRKGGFSWSTADAVQRGQDNPRELGDAVLAALADGQVALAFECPLSVPVPEVSGDGWADLGRARAGEGNRSWSAGAGTGALATGLVQLAWLLRYVADGSKASLRVTTQVGVFMAHDADLLVAEAMVTNDGKPEPVDGYQDHADALAAARRLGELLEQASSGQSESDVRCAPHVALNVAAAAAMHAGVLLDPAELHGEVLVAKARPTSGNE